jgi:hypothetical protein
VVPPDAGLRYFRDLSLPSPLVRPATRGHECSPRGERQSGRDSPDPAARLSRRRFAQRHCLGWR